MLESRLELEEKRSLRWEYGPVSFGFLMAASIVSWSDASANDLLVSRAWEGLWLYPSQGLSDEELSRQPVQVCENRLGVTLGYPLDCNGDDRDDLILADRQGLLLVAERSGDYPDVRFGTEDVLRDEKTGLPFNIPYDNPNCERLNDLGGYIDPAFYNYTYPVHFPPTGGRGADLVVGDWAGNLWWMPDRSCGHGRARYDGVEYEKPPLGRDSPARKLVERYGRRFVKPRNKLCDVNGAPILLGVGLDAGRRFEGGDTRPVVYRNPVTGTWDLLVLAGITDLRLYHLAGAGKTAEGVPVLKNMGEVSIEGLGLSTFGLYSFHSALAILEQEGWGDLVISHGCKLAVLRNAREAAPTPRFRFSRWISAPNSLAFGGNYSEILTDRSARRYFLEWEGARWSLREIRLRPQGPILAGESRALEDQNGTFTVEGETDPQGGSGWGWHRAVRWNFDGSGRQHLIVGTDKGLLYLLIDEEGRYNGAPFMYRSVGPLADSSGAVIRVHNRLCAVGFDIDGDGREDLVVGGATYQMGAELDPSPGGGLFSLLNRGVDRNGLPVLDPPRPLPIRGWNFRVPSNTHVHMQSVDVDEDGHKEIILCVQGEGPEGRVCRGAMGEAVLEDTGLRIPEFMEQWLLDIDHDGELELVFAGSEHGLGYYRKVGWPRPRRLLQGH